MMKYIVSFAIFFVIAFAPVITFAFPINLNLDYPEFGNITLDREECETSIEQTEQGLTPEKICGQFLNSLVAWLYYLIIGLSGLAAFVMLVWGGVQWLTSGAIPSQASEARDKLKSAVLGLLLILAAFLIIQVINPQLTLLNQPGLGSLSAPGSVPSFSAQPPTGPGGGSIALNADNEPSLLCVPNTSLATVQLRWVNSGVSSCQAASAPDPNLWTGAKIDNNNESITIPTGTHTFVLSCAALSDDVKVTVAPGSCTGGTPITTDLTARDSNNAVGSGMGGSIIFDPGAGGGDIPSGRIALDWTSSIDAASCDTQGGPSNGFFDVGRPITGTYEQQVSLASPGTYTYTITCIDGSGTQTDSDSVELIIEP